MKPKQDLSSLARLIGATPRNSTAAAVDTVRTATTGGSGDTRDTGGTSGLVYSTEAGRTCPKCRQAVSACRCKALAAAERVGDAEVRVWRETKGRGGKAVTLVKGLPLPPEALNRVGKQLKATCGSGGTVKDGVIEVQGDHAERVLAWLKAQGFAGKRAGG